MSDDESEDTGAARPHPKGGAPPSKDAGRARLPVVGIGASAGGLDACRKLLDALPGRTGMAFVLVQHLDPTHESLMAGLLSTHTSMKVLQAVDGMAVEAEHLYTIPPGTYLSIEDGRLRLSEPADRHGMRLPFDFFLHSLAEECGPLAICIVLSGTGNDGSRGVRDIRQGSGFVIAQEPEEAGYDGMPKSAIATGAVDAILPVAKMPEVLEQRRGSGMSSRKVGRRGPATSGTDVLGQIIALLRSRTGRDFTLYKTGTLTRRIERRMALAEIPSSNMAGYLDRLGDDQDELDQLAEDLLIHVTSFFRDRSVFEYLAESVIPDLVRGTGADRGLRVWVPGCSTGEEAYSLVMLFLEEIAATKKTVRLQVFASDIDRDAVASAREGLYPESIAADVSGKRLARFFSKEDTGYRVSPEMRSAVVFTVQNMLEDPPFSRIDLVSCRNLLIYLGPEAQARAISLLHFSLREGGLLLLGNSETPGDTDSRFKAVSKANRIYRRIGRDRPDANVLAGAVDAIRIPERGDETRTLSRESALAELCRKLVIETHAPAAVLISMKHQILYSLGPVERYLTVAPGHPSHDLLSMLQGGTKVRLRAAIRQAKQTKEPTSIAGNPARTNGSDRSFAIDVVPTAMADEDMFLVCFVDELPGQAPKGKDASAAGDPRIAELERELQATRTELESAIRELEISTEEQKAINEEALSVNEEFQSTNEELLTSKEELQSLNEELTALNGQLQETLDRQRTTSNDLQNVLYSTDVATIFLDAQLNIRFFTPATKSLFHVIATDVGRPLDDLKDAAKDDALLPDARAVLEGSGFRENEVKTADGHWYIRRVLPYRTGESGVDGVVITFNDITGRRQAADALAAAKRDADRANVAKSRFLAAASHDLRQPLQTLVLLQGVLARTTDREKEQQLVARLGQTLNAMAGMLDTLLDINQIEAGIVPVNVVDFPVNDVLSGIAGEFGYHAEAKHLSLRAVGSRSVIRSDPALLAQMIRNLVSNAIKYTSNGKVLLGCRRRGAMLRIEVWDTGIGIPATEVRAIFEEYHQVDNHARERSRGLGLGLSIVKRLADLLGHRVEVHSRLGSGSVFAIEVPLVSMQPATVAGARSRIDQQSAGPKGRRTADILLVEDDVDLREILASALADAGHHVTSTADAPSAIDLVRNATSLPGIVLADYNLPNGIDGLELVARICAHLGRQVPAIILTGDISTEALRRIASQDCTYLHKPVKLEELDERIDLLLADPQRPRRASIARTDVPAAPTTRPTVFVVDDDRTIRESLTEALRSDDWQVETYASCEAFLEAYRLERPGCLLIDAYLPGMDGFELLRRLNEKGDPLPAIMITGNSDVAMAVRAMKAGVSDFIEKPVAEREVRISVQRALELAVDAGKLAARREVAATQVAELTPRQRQIMDLVLAGHPSKNIAADLGISRRTVETHRASIMKKTGARSLPALARLALAAEPERPDER